MARLLRSSSAFPVLHNAMPRLDFSFLLTDPSAPDGAGTLTIQPLAPLSMNCSVPGKHFQTEMDPPPRQVYGMMENAFGMHFGWSNKAFGYKLKRKVAKAATADVSINGTRNRDYQPILAPYYPLELIERPETQVYDDTQWLHKWRDTSQVRGGATNHDWRATGDRPERYGYGKTPVQREHVMADGPWVYRIETTEAAAQALTRALSDPAGPLYLGTSDGWVDAAFAFDGS
jgi:hypothetical protein